VEFDLWAMKILVTGGTGVVGIGAIPALLGTGHRVSLLSRHAGEAAAAFPEGVEPWTADVSTAAGIASAVRGCEAVLHIAGVVEEEPPEITFEKINVEGTRNLVEAAGGENPPIPFVYLSSLGAERGESAYHQSKRRAEEIVRARRGPWVILRPGNVYGPGDGTVSLLLKMTRTLPAVPMVESGEQLFQPLWYRDLGRAIAEVFADVSRFAGRTLALAGREITTTDELLARMAVLTDRNPPRLAVPAWPARVGATALEAFDAAGQKLLHRLGLEAPINSAKLTMLLERNVIGPGEGNALLTEFSFSPTTLDAGLAQLADLLPEQLPGEGVCSFKQASFWADIRGSRVSARMLLEEVCVNLNRVMPIEFAAEPGAPLAAEEGKTMTAALAGRGNVQVRLEEKTEVQATFVTLESHPLAGVMQLQVEEIAGGVRFKIRTASQAADAFDWVAMKTVGGKLQNDNWREVVRRVVELSGGEAPAGVQEDIHTMDESEVAALKKWIETLVQRRQRERLRVQTQEDRPKRA
jgi:uncharacterized protein YbjT (DUF2867 family)